MKHLILITVCLALGGCLGSPGWFPYVYPVAGDYDCSHARVVTAQNGSRWTADRSCSAVSCIVETNGEGYCDLSFPQDYTQNGVGYAVGRD